MKKWTKQVPIEEGWYWMKYRNKHGITICPCEVSIFDSTGTMIHSARNDMFIYQDGKLSKPAMFGKRIEEP